MLKTFVNLMYTEPQDEDEEVLIDYLEKLILDKNLEQVDLVLKFMYR